MAESTGRAAERAIVSPGADKGVRRFALPRYQSVGVSVHPEPALIRDLAFLILSQFGKQTLDISVYSDLPEI